MPSARVDVTVATYDGDVRTWKNMYQFFFEGNFLVLHGDEGREFIAEQTIRSITERKVK